MQALPSSALRVAGSTPVPDAHLTEEEVNIMNGIWEHPKQIKKKFRIFCGWLHLFWLSGWRLFIMEQDGDKDESRLQ